MADASLPLSVGGGTGLTNAQRRSLAASGYLLIPSVLATDAVDRLVDRLEQLVRATVDALDASPDAEWEEAGVVRLRLDLDDTGFFELVRHPLLFSAAQAVIGPGCQVNGLNLRAPLPGCGHQGLHPDFYPGHRTDGPWQVLAGMWCITEFTDYNGPLRVVPGSHRSTRDPSDDMKWRGMAPQRGEAVGAGRVAHRVQQRQPVALRHHQLQPRAAPRRHSSPCSAGESNLPRTRRVSCASGCVPKVVLLYHVPRILRTTPGR